MLNWLAAIWERNRQPKIMKVWFSLSKKLVINVFSLYLIKLNRNLIVFVKLKRYWVYW